MATGEPVRLPAAAVESKLRRNTRTLLYQTDHALDIRHWWLFGYVQTASSPTLGLGSLPLHQMLDGLQMLGFVMTHTLKAGAQVEEILQLQALGHLHQPLGQA